MIYYILGTTLDGVEPIPISSSKEWGKWFATHDRHVAQDLIGKVRVSTVFIGIDMSYDIVPHKPLLWETMIFGGKHDEYQERYSSHEEALEGHYKALNLVLEDP